MKKEKRENEKEDDICTHTHTSNMVLRIIMTSMIIIITKIEMNIAYNIE